MTSAVSAVLCVIYAAFAVWMFARGVVGNGFLLLGFAVLFLLIILFSKKFQLSVMQKLMKRETMLFRAELWNMSLTMTAWR